MHLPQHKLCTRKTELVLKVKITLDSHRVTWRRTLTNRIDVKYVFPRCRFAQCNWHGPCLVPQQPFNLAGWPLLNFMTTRTICWRRIREHNATSKRDVRASVWPGHEFWSIEMSPPLIFMTEKCNFNVVKVSSDIFFSLSLETSSIVSG